MRLIAAAADDGEAVKPGARLEAAEVWVEATEDGINFRLGVLPGPPGTSSCSLLKILSLILSTSK